MSDFDNGKENEDIKIMKCSDSIKINPEDLLEGWRAMNERERQQVQGTTTAITLEVSVSVDVPNLRADFYHSQVDWSQSNIIAIGGSEVVYGFNVESGEMTTLLEVAPSTGFLPSTPSIQVCSKRKGENRSTNGPGGEPSRDEILANKISASQPIASAVSFNPSKGNLLSIGLSTGAIQLFDLDKKKVLRTMFPADNTDDVDALGGEINALRWKGSILAAAHFDGSIRLHDVRVKDHLVATLGGPEIFPEEAICQVAWDLSGGGSYIAASGGNGTVAIWDSRKVLEVGASSGANSSAATNKEALVFYLSGHCGAIKAMAFCPWRHGLLATGGGLGDQQIRLWDLNSPVNNPGAVAKSAKLLKNVHMGSQVCDLRFNKPEGSMDGELVVATGFNKKEICIMSVPALVPLRSNRSFCGGRRVLSLAVSTDATKLASIGDDRRLNIFSAWDNFTTTKEGKSVPEGKENLH